MEAEGVLTDRLSKERQLLRKRAEELSRPLATRIDVEHTLEVMVFQLADERYAIETRYIQEVYPLREYTPLPCTPPFIFGLINLRRKILTVIDLKVLFSMSGDGDTESKKVVVLQDRQRTFALLIDALQGIQRIPLDQIELNLPTLTGIRQEFLQGISMDRIAIFDGKKLLTSKHLVVDETVAVMA